LEDDKAALNLDLQHTKIAKESDKIVQEQDRAILKKLQEQRMELRSRLDKNLAEQEGKSEKDKKDLLIEEGIIRKRLGDVEKLIREEIKRRN
jgi:hypothetical protein